jgi:hypothetical protein
MASVKREERPDAAEGLTLPAVLATTAVDSTSPFAAFDRVAFRRELSGLLRGLVSSHNVGSAVQQVRAWNVPEAQQAAELTDLLTRAAEETRGLPRRRYFAFVAGLAAGEHSAFAKAACLAGARTFFSEVYPDLCAEVPRLHGILANELVPTLLTVWTAKELGVILPESMRVQLSKMGNPGICSPQRQSRNR